MAIHGVYECPGGRTADDLSHAKACYFVREPNAGYPGSMSGGWKRVMVGLLRHSQMKGAVTDWL